MALTCKACFRGGLRNLTVALVAGGWLRSDVLCNGPFFKTDGSAVDFHLAKAFGVSLLLLYSESPLEVCGGDKNPAMLRGAPYVDFDIGMCARCLQIHLYSS